GTCRGPNDSTCDNFRLTIGAPTSPFTVTIKLQPFGDWDVSVWAPDGSLAGSSGNGPNQMEIVTLTNPASGTYTVAAAPFAPLPNPVSGTYTASAELRLLGASTQPPPGTENITFANLPATNGLGGDAGEPSVGADHQSVGFGPYAAPLTRDPNGLLYPNAVYYCSQDLVAALCARSDDGGLTFTPAVPIYTDQCGGLHGHVKVAPDGTVYVPNKDCGGTQSMVVSEDNGASWAIHAVNTCTYAAKPSLVGTGDDPALSVDASGRIYFAFSNYGTSA